MQLFTLIAMDKIMIKKYDTFILYQVYYINVDKVLQMYTKHWEKT